MSRLARVRGARDGRLPSLGHDYDRGHRTYVAQLGEGQRLWLRTKPFSAPPSFELAPCLHTFAHLVERLQLGLRAQVLDAGCGPGWLSEFLVRCGYWVTGFDISEEMVEIARERVAALDGPVGEGIDPQAEFFALPVRELPWSDRFDAAVLYDTMHHFDDELETLRTIQRALVPGGWIYIREGSRPAPGSQEERALIAEMQEYGTLESPFEPRYLVSILREAGFEQVTRLLELDELVDVSQARQALGALVRYAKYRLGRGDTNTIVAMKPIAADRAAARSFAARIEPAGEWREAGPELVRELTVTNTGRAFWPAAPFPYTQGVVTLAPHFERASGVEDELPRTILPDGVSPGSQVRLEVRVPRADVGGRTDVAVDLVREGIAWFGDLGGEPLILPLPR